MTNWLPILTLATDGPQGVRYLGLGRTAPTDQAPLDARIMVRWHGGWVCRNDRGAFVCPFYPAYYCAYVPPE